MILKINGKEVYKDRTTFEDADYFDAPGTAFKQLFKQFEQKLLFEAIDKRIIMNTGLS